MGRAHFLRPESIGRGRYRDTTAPPTFPLLINGRTFQASSGERFLIRGDAAYSLIVQLSGVELAQYLDTMVLRGINTLLINLYEHKFSDNAPANALGVAPFSTPEDIRTASSTYFDHVRTVIRAAAARGMVVFLCHAYSGYNATDEGWYTTAIATRTAGECTTFGAFIGNELKDEPNIIWVQGGDYNAPSQTNINAIMNGILSTPGLRSTLCTYHTAPYSDSRAITGLTNLNINGVYVFDATGAPSNSSAVPGFLFARAATPTMLWVNYEPRYEGYASSVQWIREQIYGTVLTSGAGTIAGCEPRWHFDAPTGFITTGWVASLTSPLTLSYPFVKQLADSLRWYDLVPDTSSTLITSGRGSSGTDGYVTAGKTADNEQALIYNPGGGAITADLSQFAGKTVVVARWFDPTNGQYTTQSGSPFLVSGGAQSVTPPALNSVSARDFLLDLRAA